MAIVCPRCGAQFDFTLFQYGHGVHCDCGQWVDLSTANREEKCQDGDVRPRQGEAGDTENTSPEPGD